MTMTSLGDLAQSMMLRRRNAGVKQALQTASYELTTGKVADVTRAVKGDFAPLAAMDASLARLAGFRSVTTEAGVMAGVMQTALAKIDGLASDLAASLIASSTSGQASQVDAVGLDSRQRLESALSALNTRFAGRAVFSGTEPGAIPLPDADTLLTALQGALGAANSGASVAAAVTAWFAAPAGFSALYQGGAPRSDLPIGNGEVADLSITALDPDLRETLAGMAMGALLDRGVLAGQPAARIDLARQAGGALMSGVASRTQVAARLGREEALIERASTRNAAEVSGLEIARIGLVEADPYEAATRLEATEAQLQALYSITARLSRLSLADYL